MRSGRRPAGVETDARAVDVDDQRGVIRGYRFYLPGLAIDLCPDKAVFVTASSRGGDRGACRPVYENCRGVLDLLTPTLKANVARAGRASRR
jgi:hypothetical protein